MAEELLCTAGVPFIASPPSLSPHADPEFTDLDLDTFLLSSPTPASPSSASASSPPCPKSFRCHPPPRHRRCLFRASSPPADPADCRLPPTPFVTGSSDAKSCRKRGAYNCGKCGQPKRGHVCEGEAAPKALVLQQYMAKRQPHPQAGFPIFADQDRSFPSPYSPLPQSNLPSEASRPVSSSSLTSSCSSNERCKRALQLTVAAASESVEASAVADADASIYSDNSSYELEVNEAREDKATPLTCLVLILSRLLPHDLVAASSVCRRWRQCAEYVWAGVRQTSISIKASRSNSLDVDGDFLPFILRKCSSLQELTLNVTSQLGDQLLKRISTFSRYLISLEVSLKPGGANTISGEGLKDLFRHCKSLTSVKFEGCDRVVEVELSSPRLATLWLTGCHHLKYMFLNCPELSELCLDFLPPEDVGPARQNNEKSDSLAAILKNLGSTARGLMRLHVASPWLQDRVIHGLFSPGLKSLRMLSLTFGLGITDHSVAAIAATCEGLELLDLSGSSITDMALELICKSFSTSLSKLLIALCPKVSEVGLQMVVSKLPILQLLDCGKVISDKKTDIWTDEEELADSTYFIRSSNSGAKSRCGELRLHHQHLRKLSLWGCTGLKMLALDCPNLVDLNLTGCSNLEPDGLQLVCPSLKDVYVGKCDEQLLEEIQCQLELAHFDSRTVWRARADGSKRVKALNVRGKFTR